MKKIPSISSELGDLIKLTKFSPNMESNKHQWNYYEFRTYLLLYAANADFVVQKEEHELILANSSKKEYQHIHKIFCKDSDFERIETIQSFREQFFPKEEDVDRILSEVSVLLNVDEDINLYERNFYMMLEKILRNQS